MKKLTLDLDTLAVESFIAQVDEEAGGTVDGQQVISPGHSCLRTRCCPDTYEPGCTG